MVWLGGPAGGVVNDMQQRFKTAAMSSGWQAVLDHFVVARVEYRSGVLGDGCDMDPAAIRIARNRHARPSEEQIQAVR